MYIILMAGGVGTRFWPMSRKTRPKQTFAYCRYQVDVTTDL